MEAVETVEDLTRVAFRWLRLSFNQAVAPSVFDDIPGVNAVMAENSTLRVQWSGTNDMNALLKQAVEHGVINLDIEYPTLEEIFLTYYGEKGRK